MSMHVHRKHVLKWQNIKESEQNDIFHRSMIPTWPGLRGLYAQNTDTFFDPCAPLVMGKQRMHHERERLRSIRSCRRREQTPVHHRVEKPHKERLRVPAFSWGVSIKHVCDRRGSRTGDLIRIVVSVWSVGLAPSRTVHDHEVVDLGRASGGGSIDW